MEDQVLGQMEKQRLTVNETADKVDFLQTKILTIEKHLPTMIQEILEYYFDKKMSDFQSQLVDQKTFKEALQCKLDANVFRAFEKAIATDRTREEQYFVIDERIHTLETAFPTLVNKDEFADKMEDKASNFKIDEIKSLLENQKQLSFTENEKLGNRLDQLKKENEEKAVELMDEMLTLKAQLDKIEEEGEEGESYDEEEDEDLGSELEDTLDVNELPGKGGVGSPGGSSGGAGDGEAGDDVSQMPDDEEEGSEMMEGSRSKGDLSDISPSKQSAAQNLQKTGSKQSVENYDALSPQKPTKDGIKDDGALKGKEDKNALSKVLDPHSMTMKSARSRGASVTNSIGQPPVMDSRMREQQSPTRIGATGTESDLLSTSNKQSSRKRGGVTKRRILGGQNFDASSRADTISVNSGFQSRYGGGKKKSLRKGTKRSVSIAMQNETLINKIQEQLTDFKKQMDLEISRVDGRIEETSEEIKKGLADFKENNTKPMMDVIQEKIKSVNQMQESQNYVLKDLHDKRIEMNKRLIELEKTDFEDKFNRITRKMIADVVRDLLTPI